jgi:hypothetical protein
MLLNALRKPRNRLLGDRPIETPGGIDENTLGSSPSGIGNLLRTVDLRPKSGWMPGTLPRTVSYSSTRVLHHNRPLRHPRPPALAPCRLTPSKKTWRTHRQPRRSSQALRGGMRHSTTRIPPPLPRFTRAIRFLLRQGANHRSGSHSEMVCRPVAAVAPQKPRR